MSTVDSKTSIKIDELVNGTVISGYVTPDGELILVTRGGAEINAGNVGSEQPIGELWVSTTPYVIGDVVSYAGALWKALYNTVNEPPSLFTRIWTRLTGEVPAIWTERDPYFSGDDINTAWNFSIKTGSPVVSFTSVPGESESGGQALKISMAVSESQQFYQTDESIVLGADVVTVQARARLLSANPNARLDAFLVQNDDQIPTPGMSGTVTASSDTGGQALTTAWETYTFLITAAAANPRASINMFASCTSSGGAVFLFDYIRILRDLARVVPGGGVGGGGLVIEQSFASAVTPWIVTHGQGTKGLSVYTENSLGVPIEGGVSYPDVNTIRIDFFYPQTGLARVFN